MKTDTLPEARRYLAAVDRAAGALPRARRRELLEDLGEHIEMALEERPGEVEEILAELGDPQDIAATALREESSPAQSADRRGHPRVVVALWALVTAVGILVVLPACGWLGPAGAVLLGAGVVTLWRSGWWSTERKWTATAALILPNFVLGGLADLAGHSGAVDVVRHVLAVAARVAALVWLWQRRVRPEGPAWIPVPRRLRILLWTVVSAAVLVVLVLVVGGAVTYFGLSGSVHGADLH